MNHMEREAVRYLGYGKHAVDDQTEQMIQESFRELESVAQKRSIYRIFDVSARDDGEIKIAKEMMYSKALAKNLKGCNQVVLFGATLGSGVDQLIRKESILNMAKAVVLQACAAAMLEEYCDECQNRIGNALEKESCYLRPRFSPGYGDFDIEYQRPLVRMLDCAKTIGLTITDSCMMSPTKSVTAVIGVSQTKEPCHRQGCECCEKKDCEYRRDTL